MFCNQCEQTAKGTGCTVKGVCGKLPEVAALQDLLGHAVKGLALYAHEGRRIGLVDNRVNRFTAEALFSTLTNVNFDSDRLKKILQIPLSRHSSNHKPAYRISATGGGTVCGR